MQLPALPVLEAFFLIQSVNRYSFPSCLYPRRLPSKYLHELFFYSSFCVG